MMAKGLLAGCLALALLAGCGIPVEDGARPLSADEIPPSLPDQAPAPNSPRGGQGSAWTEVFFVRESRLQPVRREASIPPSVEGALAMVLRGPTPGERSEGVRTAVTSQVRLAGTVAAGVPLIEVTESFGQVEGQEQILALAQLVYTLTGVRGVNGVSFALSGRPVEVPTGDGTLKRGPLRRPDFEAVAPVG